MIPTATSRIEGIASLQHHDLVTGEAIVGPNLLEQRHRAPRRSARSTASSRTTSSAPSRPRLPALNRTPLGSEAARNRIPASRGAPSGAPSTPASARTAARIHRNPGHLPSTATSRAASTRRVRCPRTPAHRAVLAPSTTYSPHRVRRGQRPVRPPASHRDGHLRTGAECGAPANLPVPAERNGPGNRPVTHRVKRPGGSAARQRARAARNRVAGCNLTRGQTHRRPCRFHERELTAAGCAGRESDSRKSCATRAQNTPVWRLTARAAYFGRSGSPVSAEVDRRFRLKWITFGRSGSVPAEVDHPVWGVSARR